MTLHTDDVDAVRKALATIRRHVEDALDPPAKQEAPSYLVGRLKAIGGVTVKALAALDERGSVAVPDGWKLVPREPTDHMKGCITRGEADTPTRLWRAMWDAAPPREPISPEGDHHHHDHGARAVQGSADGWLPSETAPTDDSVFLTAYSNGEVHLGKRSPIGIIVPFDCQTMRWDAKLVAWMPLPTWPRTARPTESPSTEQMIAELCGVLEKVVSVSKSGADTMAFLVQLQALAVEASQVLAKIQARGAAR